MKTLLTLLGGLAALGILTYLCATRHRPFFEQDLTARTHASLDAASIKGASVSAEGLIITLTGEVPDEAARRRAGELAAAVYGVAEVRNLLSIAPAIVSAAPRMTVEERKAAVDCQAEFSTLLREPIRFATSRSVINADSYPLLDKLATAAKKCPAAQIEVGGHTDSSGDHARNVKLSESRANAVVSYLVSKGIAAGRLSAAGYGPDKPVADNATPEGMQKNRRTEFTVKGL